MVVYTMLPNRHLILPKSSNKPYCIRLLTKDKLKIAILQPKPIMICLKSRLLV